MAICPEMLATTKMVIEENLPNVLNEMVKDTQKRGDFDEITNFAKKNKKSLQKRPNENLGFQ